MALVQNVLAAEEHVSVAGTSAVSSIHFRRMRHRAEHSSLAVYGATQLWLMVFCSMKVTTQSLPATPFGLKASME